MKRWQFLVASVFALSLVACGGNEQTEAPNEEAQVAAGEQQALEQVVKFTDAMGKAHEFATAPKSIATLNPGMMDILMELGANVTGRPTIHADMAEEVKAIQEIGNPHEPSIEQIVLLNPEVLIVPPNFQQFAATIEATGIQVIYENMDSIDAIQATITRYGDVFDNMTKAKVLNAEIEEALAKTTVSTKNALIVYGAPGTYLAALDTSLYGNILTAAGGKNIASNLPALDKYPTFASLSAEKIVEGNPQIIMLITHADPAQVKEGFEKQMNENAAWKNVDAVKNDRIIILPSQLFDNPGTQVVEALDYMRDLLVQAEQEAK